MKRLPPQTLTAALFVALFGAASLRYPGFGSFSVGVGLVTDQAVLGLLALGMTFVILTGGIDLSVGSAMALSGMACVWLLEKTSLPDPLALLVPLALGTGFGWLQGRLIADLKLPPFLVTLGGLFAFQGLANLAGEGSMQSQSPLLKSFTQWSLSLPGGITISVPTLAFLVLALVLALVLRQTRFGRTAMALGGGGNSAFEMGLPVRATLVRVYALNGFCAALAGLVYVVYTGSGDPLTGIGRELEAISACVIGGSALAGGRGSIIGAVLGALTIGVIQAAIIFDGTLSSWWGKIAVAGLLGLFLIAQGALSKPRA